jgi:hypothetical protein
MQIFLMILLLAIGISLMIYLQLDNLKFFKDLDRSIKHKV